MSDVPPSAGRAGGFDPLRLTVFANAVAMIAEEMGTVLVRGALSPNIRERRDASAAIFDAEGRMVAQAAHIPVHLGAMPESVRAVRERGPRPGDVFLLNDPFAGGSHLPDLTLVEAIGAPDASAPGTSGALGVTDGSRAAAARGAADEIIGYAAVRAHHADVGGMSPGSMPPGATELVQEGIIIPPIRIANERGWNEEMLALVLANVRTPQERRGDLAAQRAACAAGARGWRALRAREGAATLDAAVRALLDYTERRARARLASLEGASGMAEDALEGDGVTDASVRIAVSARISDGTLHLDLSGSAPQVRGNVNCPLAVTRAAAVFVLRTLLDEDVPTNEGIARAIDIIAPEGSVVNARWPAAVAAGNVETSQRITDTIFAALADAGIPVPAQGQGTMNNVMFGGAGWTFYETIGGGQGASAHAPGPSAVHVGMSNTRNTPIEALETAYPIRIDEYAVRRGSGGAGAQRGGDGVIRRYRVLAHCTLTLLTERRTREPRGIGGGGDGARGRNLLDGRSLAAKCRVELEPGQVVTIETPGGGAYGGR